MSLVPVIASPHGGTAEGITGHATRSAYLCVYVWRDGKLPEYMIFDCVYTRKPQPSVEDATPQDREALQLELDRVVRTANESNDYESINAGTNDLVTRCEKKIRDMFTKEVSFRARTQPLACIL